MGNDAPHPRFLFPKWTNHARRVLVVGVVGGIVFLWVLVSFAFSPQATAVGYQPKQPVPFSHKIHAGKLGMDCRYCHNTIESAPFAALPATQTCMNCHAAILPASDALEPVRDSWQSGHAIEWTQVHNLPKYAYFNHQAHVTHGVACATCHGRIDQMDTVRQVKPLSMSWCLDCHREPEKFLSPREELTNMAWKASDHPLAKERGLSGDPVEAQRVVGLMLKDQYEIRPAAYMQACSTCHR